MLFMRKKNDEKKEYDYVIYMKVGDHACDIKQIVYIYMFIRHDNHDID